MPHTLDAAVVRAWCARALDSVGRARETIDALNVYPVADSDTGTNLYLTLEAAGYAVEAACAGSPTPAEALRAMAHGALLGAHGNSGTILAQLLRGMAEATAEGGDLRQALDGAARSAWIAVAHPVEGTILTVASAAAEAAAGTAGADDAAAARAACTAARTALARTPERLEVLAEAGVVDAGGYGLVTVLDALLGALTGEHPMGPLAERAAGVQGRVRVPSDARAEPWGGAPSADGPGAADAFAPKDVASPAGGPGYEVIYLLEAADRAVAVLREALDPLGDSLVVVGGDGLWNVHVHVDDPGAAVEAGIEAGRPHRIRITHLADRTAAPAPAGRAVLVLMPGDGLAGLCVEAGATVVTVHPEEPPGSGELVDAVRRAHVREAVLLPGAEELRHTAAAAAEQVRAEGIRVAIVPTRSPVQSLAALAVHAPDRRFDEDVIAMTSAAGATRYGELAVAEAESWTTAGVCQAGDVLGLIDGDVCLIGRDPAAVAEQLLDRMLAAGGELVTLVPGTAVPDGLVARLQERVRRRHLGVDALVHEGRQPAPLLIGVE